jgi:hypothetical protein
MTEESMEEKVEKEVFDENDEPIYYKPSSLNLVASLSMWFSWLVLVGFVLVVAGQVFNLLELSQGAPIMSLLKEAGARNWIYTNLVLPLLTGLALFVTLQGVHIGLNVLLEIDFNMREPKN